MGNNIADIVNRPRVKHPFTSNAWVLASLWETCQHAWKEIHARQSTQDLLYF